MTLEPESQNESDAHRRLVELAATPGAEANQWQKSAVPDGFSLAWPRLICRHETRIGTFAVCLLGMLQAGDGPLFSVSSVQWPGKALDRQLSNDNDSNAQNGAVLPHTFVAEICSHQLFLPHPPIHPSALPSPRVCATRILWYRPGGFLICSTAWDTLTWWLCRVAQPA